MKLPILLAPFVLIATTVVAQETAPALTVRPELAVLRSPGFRERLAQSYLAESDVEPPLTAAERKALVGAVDLVAAAAPPTR